MTPNWKPEKGSGKLARHARRVAEEQRLRDAYAEVDARDQSICAVTGRFLLPGAVMADCRREHHHLKGRRVRPDWVYKAERIITVSALAHELIEGGFIDVEGEDARQAIFYHWSAAMKGRIKPFRIMSRRTEVA